MPSIRKTKRKTKARNRSRILEKMLYAIAVDSQEVSLTIWEGRRACTLCMHPDRATALAQGLLAGAATCRRTQ